METGSNNQYGKIHIPWTTPATSITVKCLLHAERRCSSGPVCYGSLRLPDMKQIGTQTQHAAVMETSKPTESRDCTSFCRAETPLKHCEFGLQYPL